jgi:outer membrane murein-binding lipoprotein Lpp
MYRKFASLLLVVACLSLAGCGNKEAQVNSFINEINTFTDELVKKIESAPNPSQGADDAQKYLDSRKADLRAKFDSVKQIKVTEETQKKIQTDLFEDGKKLGQAVGKNSSDPAAREKLAKLVQEYGQLFQP